MKIAQLLWIIVVCASWGALAIAVSRYRSRTGALTQWMDYKSRLPDWVKLAENAVLLVLWLPLVIASELGLLATYQYLHPAAHASVLSIVLFTLSSAVVSWPVTALIANQISVLIPPIRDANLRAMTAVSTVSFGSANRGLILMALVVVPLSAIQAAIGLIEPWAG